MPDEENLDACCGICGSIWHPTDGHPGSLLGYAAEDEPPFRFPPGYDPAEADRLIGRKPT